MLLSHWLGAFVNFIEKKNDKINPTNQVVLEVVTFFFQI